MRADEDEDDARDALVSALSEVLHLDDRELARARLVDADWDLQRAVERALGAASDGPSVREGAHESTGLRRRARAGSSRDERRGRGSSEASGSIRRVQPGAVRARGLNPFAFAAALGVGIVRAVVKLSVSVVDAALRIALPTGAYTTLSRPLTLLSRALGGPARRLPAGVLEGDEASEQRAKEFSEWFAESFYAQGTTNAVRFMQLSHRDALQFARRETKLLFVYIHSPLHHESEVFCSQVLASPEVGAYVNANFVAWGGSVRDGDARAFANGINVSAYPYVALLDSVSGSGTSLVMSCEGFLDVDGLIGACEEALSSQNTSLDSARARVAEADANRRLREEQEAAFAESLARDAARAREVEVQREREEAERARIAEEQRVAEEKKMREEEAERARLETIESRRVEKTKALKLRDEPQDGAEGVSKLAIRLPDGSRAERRFYSTDTIADVYDFVDTLEDLDEAEYSLITNFPRRTFARGDTVSLVDAGVHPNGALFVQTEK